MPVEICARFAFHLDQPGDVLLQFEAAAIPEQKVLSCETQFAQAIHLARVPAQANIGERVWVRAEGPFSVGYWATVEVERVIHDIASLARLDPHELPGEAAEYLFDSRYCQADRLHSFVAETFGHLEGGAKIAAMRDWISDHFTYEPGASTTATTAIDSFLERRGVCRDYAHVMVAFARAAAIPARYVSCFAPGVNPPDFHAIAEVFLDDPEVDGGGAWYLVDATGMADPEHTVKIGVGRDAADVSFLTPFGLCRFDWSEVTVSHCA